MSGNGPLSKAERQELQRFCRKRTHRSAANELCITTDVLKKALDGKPVSITIWRLITLQLRLRLPPMETDAEESEEETTQQ